MSSKTKRSKKNSSKFENILFLILIILAVFSAFSIAKYFSDKARLADNIDEASDVNTATEVEPSESDDEATKYSNDIKDEMEKNEEKREEGIKNESGKTVATPIISYVDVENGVVEVGGYVSNIVERVGVCTYVFTSGDNYVAYTKNALPSAKNTGCEALQVAVSDLAASKEWSVRLEYKSNQAEGSSEIENFEIR